MLWKNYCYCCMYMCFSCLIMLWCLSVSVGGMDRQMGGEGGRGIAHCVVGSTGRLSGQIYLQCHACGVTASMHSAT